tara:strand:+ start:909 stop:1778 length:870 start_codon:yes stop_codon:yes gene_type:complete
MPCYTELYAQIDTDQYARQVNGETYHGLPDSHDFSKDKDFFGIFPSLYCSGKKKDDKYIVDYCSPWGKQFFDLHRLWRVWGVDLIQDNLIGQAPRHAFIGLLIGAAATALAIFAGFLTFWFYWGALLSALCAWIAAITAISSAAFSNVFINKLVTTSSTLKLTGTGKIVVHPGRAYEWTIWIAAAISLAGALTWSFVVWRKRSARGKKIADKRDTGGYVGIIRRTTGDLFGKMSARDTSYKHLNRGHELTELNSRDGSQIDLIPAGRLGRVEDHGDIAYEPMRHRELSA